MSDCGCGHSLQRRPRLTFNQVLQYDPTRTLTLRDRFARDMRSRFNQLVSVIWETIVTNDAFGLNNTEPVIGTPLFPTTILGIPVPVGLVAAPPNAFAFPRSADKVEAFMDWLKIQDEEFILSGGVRGIRTARIPGRVGSAEEAWTSIYIESGYQAGIRRGRQELRKAGADIPDFGDTAQNEVTIAFNQPFHADRVGLLYTRTFAELQGITAQMDQQISRVLAQGLAEGRNPRELARLLQRVITGTGGDLSVTDTLGRYIPARRRAETLARTEIIRAHHQASIQEYRNAGILGVTVLAEFTTAGDSRVCVQCDNLEGRIFTLDEIEFIIPVHPNCRCIAIPRVQEDINALIANGFEMSELFANSISDDYSKLKET